MAVSLQAIFDSFLQNPKLILCKLIPELPLRETHLVGLESVLPNFISSAKPSEPYIQKLFRIN